MNAKKTPAHCTDFPDCGPWREWVTTSLEEGADRFDQHQQAIAENTELTKQIEQNTRELVEMMATIKAGAAVLFKVGGFANRAARWAVPIITLVGIIWGLMHGQWPRGGE